MLTLQKRARECSQLTESSRLVSPHPVRVPFVVSILIISQRTQDIMNINVQRLQSTTKHI